MRKWFAILLSLLMLFSLAACGEDSGGGGGGSGGTEPPEGYDAEYTVYVNGSDEWTPFSGKSGVSFVLSNDKGISASDDGAKISFTGKQVSETVITAVFDGMERKALVRVRAMEISYIPVRYVPLNDFLIEYTEGYGNDITLGVIGNEFVRFGEETYPCHYICGSDSSKRYYDDGSGWQYDENYHEKDDGDGLALIENTRRSAEDYYNQGSLVSGLAMFDNYFYSSSFSSAGQSISEGYVGTEVIANIECWVYECRNVRQGGTYKFWVNPDNGHCLKFLADNDLKWEVKEINLELTEWPQEWGIK